MIDTGRRGEPNDRPVDRRPVPKGTAAAGPMDTAPAGNASAAGCERRLTLCATGEVDGPLTVTLDIDPD